MPAEKISYALNQRLPEDIVVQDSCEVPDTFHPRFSRSRKTYEYRILNRRFRMPTRRLDTYFYHYPLDVEKMQEAADYLVGEHDFKSFCAVNAQSKTSVRTIYACTVTKKEDIITIRVTGSGFLYNMVRIIAGTLIKVGAGEAVPSVRPVLPDGPVPQQSDRRLRPGAVHRQRDRGPAPGLPAHPGQGGPRPCRLPGAEDRGTGP